MLKNIFNYSLGSLLTTGINLLITLVSIKIFRPEIFGKVSLYILSYNLIYMICLAGVDQGFSRFYFENKENLLNYVIKLMSIPLIICSNLFLLALLNSQKISFYIFDVDDINIIIILFLQILILIFNKFVFLIIRLEEKSFIFSIFQIALQLFNLLSIVILNYFLEKKYQIVPYSNLISYFIVTVFGIFYLVKLDLFRLKIKKKMKISEILKYSFPYLFSSCLIWIIQSADKIMLKEYSSYKELGLYSASFKIIGMLNIIQTTFNTIVRHVLQLKVVTYYR